MPISLLFDYLCRNSERLNTNDVEILQGSKNGRFISLKSKIERFQKIMRKDKTSVIILSDNNQISEPFMTLFNNFEELRNASVHYSPLKSKIWLKPHDWVDKAKEFSELVIEASLIIWKSCHETEKGPDYLGRLEYDRLYKIALEKEELLNGIK